MGGGAHQLRHMHLQARVHRALWSEIALSYVFGYELRLLDEPIFEWAKVHSEHESVGG